MRDFKLTNRRQGDVHISDDWLPPPEVVQFVRDAVADRVGERDLVLAGLDHKWIPLGIVGTLFWVEVTEWWVMENSGISITGESHETAHLHNTSRLDPAKLVVLRHLHEQLERAREDSWESGSLNDSEAGELLGFLKRQCYESSGVAVPPFPILVAISWGTLQFVLQDEGQDWIAKISDTFRLTLMQGVAYQSSEMTEEGDPELLENQLIETTEDLLGSCQKCGHRLFCVRGHAHVEPGKREASWVDLCHNCALEEVENLIHFDELTRLPDVNTMCNFQYDGKNLDCASHKCPHIRQEAADQFQQWTAAKLRERGSQRLLAFEEQLNRQGGLIRQQDVGRYLSWAGVDGS